jgi:ABC-2 type transport system ATP-binding protein
MRAIGPVAGFGGDEARMPIVKWREQGMPRQERTADPFGFATALGARLGGAPDELEIMRPSLEDIYLALVAEAEAGPTRPEAPRDAPAARGGVVGTVDSIGDAVTTGGEGR